MSAKNALRVNSQRNPPNRAYAATWENMQIKRAPHFARHARADGKVTKNEPSARNAWRASMKVYQNAINVRQDFTPMKRVARTVMHAHRALCLGKMRENAISADLDGGQKWTGTVCKFARIAAVEDFKAVEDAEIVPQALFHRKAQESASVCATPT